MIGTKGSFYYNGFGLRFLCDIDFPELLPLDTREDLIDVNIMINEMLPLPEDQVPFEFIVNENEVQFIIPSAASFSVQDGRRILFHPYEDADFNLIRLFILGTCMGILLMQRRVLPLHGSAIVINGKAYAFVGESGVGKSTLASTFIEQGFSLISDDLISTIMEEKGERTFPFVTPSYPQQKLWDDSLKSLGIENVGFQSIYGREKKYSIPVTSNFQNETVPLAGVFELLPSKEEHIIISPAKGLERLRILSNHTYRNFLIPDLGLMEWHFNMITRIASEIKLYQLRRPLIGYSAPQLAETILDIVQRGDW